MSDQHIIIEENTNENWDAYQPSAEMVQHADYLQIRFTRKTADAVNIYKRKRAGESWEFIATAVNSPYDDHDSDDDWEYCIRGVKGKAEVGVPALLSANSKKG